MIGLDRLIWLYPKVRLLDNGGEAIGVYQGVQQAFQLNLETPLQVTLIEKDQLKCLLQQPG